MNILLKAISDPTRREILRMLRKRDMTAGEIADAFDMTKPSISHHLDMLRKANLVVSVKEGQFITYSLNTTELDELIQWIYTITKK
jgi:DNA-binding transcriptional ArsR family regulator